MNWMWKSITHSHLSSGEDTPSMRRVTIDGSSQPLEFSSMPLDKTTSKVLQLLATIREMSRNCEEEAEGGVQEEDVVVGADVERNASREAAERKGDGIERGGVNLRCTYSTTSKLQRKLGPHPWVLILRWIPNT